MGITKILKQGFLIYTQKKIVQQKCNNFGHNSDIQGEINHFIFTNMKKRYRKERRKDWERERRGWGERKNNYFLTIHCRIISIFFKFYAKTFNHTHSHTHTHAQF